jgi:replicative DNA helicase
MNADPGVHSHVSSVFRAPPANIDAEKALLGAIMMNNRCFEQVAEIVEADHFIDPVHGRIYAACKRVIEVGHQANVVTLKTYLERDELLAGAGGMVYLAALCGSVVTLINAGDYAKLIRDLYLKRRLIELGEQLVAAGLDDDGTAQSLIEAHEARLTDLTAGAQLAKEETFRQAADIALAEWDAADRDEGGGVSCGLKAVEDIMGKMQGGDLIFIAGNTSMGKTALATTISMTAAISGARTSFFSLEMSSQQLASRILTGITGIPGPRQRRWKLNEAEWGKLQAAQRKYAELPLTIRFAPGLSLAALRSSCRRMKRKGLDLVVVDYLQIMGRSRDDRYENRVREISELTMGLKTLAGELQVPIIVLSQLSRENWKRDNPRPQLSDLRDSGSIEQDADTVIFCFREEYFLERNKPVQKETETKEKWCERLANYERRLEACRGLAEAIIAKHRHGPPGTARLAFDGKRAWFEDHPDYREDLSGVRDPSASDQTRMEL